MINTGNALRHLAEARKYHEKEIVVQTEMKDMFKSLGMGPVLARKVGKREADIHVTDYNCVVETKATGNANPGARGSRGETQRQQLFYYVEGLRQTIRSEFDFDGIADKPWVGILTDGRCGWVWRWESNGRSSPQELSRLRWETRDTDPRVLENTQEALGDRPIGKKWAPDEIYEVFRDDEEEFQALYAKLTRDHEKHPEIKTKFGLWLERLRGSGMAPEHEWHQHELFIKHCFLVAVAKAVIGALTPETEDDDPRVVLSEGFTAWLVENDEGLKKANALFQKARDYNWRFRFGDVLRNLYEQCIDKNDRKIYGEYYTPDWVAEQMAEEVLDNNWIETAAGAALKSIDGEADALNGIGVLDPACGSGTFLYHAARRIARASILRREKLDKRAQAVAKLVHGIDIHPVAVEMAKATLLRALPPPPSKNCSGQSFSGLLNIVQGDSLLVTEFQGGLYKDVEFVSPKGTEFRLPKKVAQHHEFRRFLPKLVEAARDGKSMPEEVPDELKTSLELFLSSLTKVIEDEGNSVWTWYILNTLGPSQLSDKKVNRILANPPWVRMSNIQVRNRKKEIENLAKELKLWVGGKHATGFDIAALFILRCRNLYLDEKTGKAAWITNNAAIRGGNWEGFRRRYGQFLAKMIDYGKLKEQPFGGAKSCALIEDNSTKTATAKTTDKLFHLIEDVKKRISPYWKWEEVRDATYLEPAPEPILKGKSDYVGKFRNGATLFPQCLLLVEKMNTEKSGRVMVETRKSCRAPWRNIESPRETVPRRWIIPCIFSNDLLPFTIRPEITQVIIPLGEDGTLEGDPEKDAYWGKADKVWRENRGRGKRNPNYLLNRINFNSALEKQLPITRNNADLCRVVYNGAGQHLRATRCRRSKVLVEHTCYWWDTNSEREAQYLVSMLNSQCLQDAYRECRKSDRHFETHVWNGVPIPCYEPRNDYHLELAGLCLEAENLAAKILRDLDLSNKQVKLSRQIKDALKESGISDRIDEAARKILPDQAR